jgi:hypothetical protein
VVQSRQGRSGQSVSQSVGRIWYDFCNQMERNKMEKVTRITVYIS